MDNFPEVFVAETATVPTRKRRSGISADPYILPGVDMRTQRGRRYRDLVDALIGEFGPSDPVRIRELASLKFTMEETQGRVVEGDPTACEDLVRIGNLIARREAELKLRRRPTPAISLADRLKAKADARA